MTELNSLNLKEILLQILSEIFTANPHLIPNSCSCHVIDPSKMRILSWKSVKQTNAFILKIAEQKFLGLPRTDKNGEVYWKFRDFAEEKISEPTDNNNSEPSSSTVLEDENIAKFQSRQAKVEQLNK